MSATLVKPLRSLHRAGFPTPLRPVAPGIVCAVRTVCCSRTGSQRVSKSLVRCTAQASQSSCITSFRQHVGVGDVAAPTGLAVDPRCLQGNFRGGVPHVATLQSISCRTSSQACPGPMAVTLPQETDEPQTGLRPRPCKWWGDADAESQWACLGYRPRRGKASLPLLATKGR